MAVSSSWRHDSTTTAVLQNCQANRYVLTGLTGSVGGGKSTAAAYWHARYDAMILDVDDAVDALWQQDEVHQKVADYLGQTWCSGMRFQRDELRHRLLSDVAFRQWLEQWFHPQVRQWVMDQLQVLPILPPLSYQMVIIVVPLLAVSAFTWPMHSIVTVEADDAIRSERLLARGWDLVHIQQMMALQNKQQEQRLAISDYQLNNSGTLSQFHVALDRLYFQIMDVPS